MNVKHKQAWISTASTDGLFILSPPFLALVAVLLFPDTFKSSDEMPWPYWLILVVFIDVAHVYTTLYRTYFKRQFLQTQPVLLIAVPLLCYVAGVMLYQVDSLWFWRVLAYLAVFHFVRQQYGFMRIYSRHESASRFSRSIDTLTIYSSTIYPLIFWHFEADRNFAWFVKDDFLRYHLPVVSKLTGWVYLLILVLYFVKEIYRSAKQQHLNLPKQILILGTVTSWYFGIVYFNGDMAFTTLNVVAHGIPYMALVWFMERKAVKQRQSTTYLQRLSFGKAGIVVFILSVIGFAYLEEGLWDGLIWNEHRTAFPLFYQLPQVKDFDLLALLIPLLALPQSTHYVLDGFIWRSHHQVDHR